jgi:hypothetical protein
MYYCELCKGECKVTYEDMVTYDDPNVPPRLYTLAWLELVMKHRLQKRTSEPL